MLARGFLLLIGVVVGAGATYYVQDNEWQKQRDALLEVHDRALNLKEKQLVIDVQALRNQIDELQTKAMIDQSTIARFTDETAKLQKDLSDRNEELVFYESMLPSDGSGSLSLRGFEASREGERIRYKLILSRSSTQKKNFSGSLQFKAKGYQNGQEVQIVLSPEQVTDPANLKKSSTISILRLDFLRLQRSQGLLILPRGFEPFEITVNVIEGKNVRITKTVIL